MEGARPRVGSLRVGRIFSARFGRPGPRAVVRKGRVICRFDTTDWTMADSVNPRIRVQVISQVIPNASRRARTRSAPMPLRTVRLPYGRQLAAIPAYICMEYSVRR